MTKLFNDSEIYTHDDPLILRLLGTKANQAQMRYHGRSPCFFRLGRKIVYHGHDLNAWADAQRKEVTATP